MREHVKHGLLPEGRDGAGDESTGRDVAGMAKKITWWQAAEILGISDRHMRRDSILRAIEDQAAVYAQAKRRKSLSSRLNRHG